MRRLIPLATTYDPKSKELNAETRPTLAREPGSGPELTPKSQILGKSVLIKHVPSSGS